MKKMKILVVDDDEPVAELIKLRLTKDADDFLVAVAGSGPECLEYLKSNPVDCIISDYQMPDMDGLELLRSLRKLGNDVPFIFMTGHSSAEIAREACRAGADDYFPKSIGLASFSQVIDSIRRSVEHRTARRLPPSCGKPAAQCPKAVWRFDMDPPVPISLAESEQVNCIFRNAYLAECNEEGARILGLSRGDDAVGMRQCVVMPPNDERNIEHVKKAVRSGYWLNEEEVLTCDAQGRTRRVLSTFNGILEQGFLVRAWRVIREPLN